MADYNFQEVEKKWQEYWEINETFNAKIDPSRSKFYALDMFPYPSGAGLHVGHPLGYIASDIIARYKRLQGYNVLHPMGYDSFGLPAEQYAIQTGQHPAITTEQNIKRYTEQLKNIGFAFDWAKEVERRGAGEILFTSMNNDGTKEGFANKALARLSEELNIPVIASGGAGNMQHFCDAFLEGKADAALAASVFHFKEIEISDLKNELHKQGIPVRITI